jgi:cyclophilin-like protein
VRAHKIEPKAVEAMLDALDALASAWAAMPRGTAVPPTKVLRWLTKVGDIAYWAPGPDVAIFYGQGGERIDSGLFEIGHVDNEVSALNVSGEVDVKIELIDQDRR